MSTVEDDVVVDRGSRETVSFASWCRDLSHISWVFSAFSFRPFCPIQQSSRSIHSAKRTAACWLWTTGALIYTCVSSAYVVFRQCFLSKCVMSYVGIVLAVRRCLMQKTLLMSVNEFALLLARIKQQSASIIDLVLAVFGGNLHSDGNVCLITV